MGTRFTHAPGQPSEALQLPELGCAAWEPEAHLRPACNVAGGAEAQAHVLRLSNAQILQLLDNLPEGEVHDRWRFALQLCAVYGFRP